MTINLSDETFKTRYKDGHKGTNSNTMFNRYKPLKKEEVKNERSNEIDGEGSRSIHSDATAPGDDTGGEPRMVSSGATEEEQERPGSSSRDEKPDRSSSTDTQPDARSDGGKIEKGQQVRTDGSTTRSEGGSVSILDGDAELDRRNVSKNYGIMSLNDALSKDTKKTRFKANIKTIKLCNEIVTFCANGYRVYRVEPTHRMY